MGHQQPLFAKAEKVQRLQSPAVLGNANGKGIV